MESKEWKSRDQGVVVKKIEGGEEKGKRTCEKGKKKRGSVGKIPMGSTKL